MERMAHVEPSCDTRARTSILVRDHYLGTGIKSSGWNDCCVWRLAEIWLQLLPAKPQNPVRKNPHDAQKFLSPFRQTATAINPGGAAILGPRRGGRLCSKSFATAASAGQPSSAFRTVATARRPNGSTASGMTSDVSKAGATRLEPATQPHSPRNT